MVRQQYGFSVVVVAVIVLFLVGATGQVIYSRQKDKSSISEPKTAQSADDQKAISQGVRGKITILTGDCMPKIEPAQSNCHETEYTTLTTVVIKRPLDLKDKENKELVTKIENVRGAFQVQLDPGLYNFYIIYQDKEYCTLYGSQAGEDCEFTVVANKVTEYNYMINAAVH